MLAADDVAQVIVPPPKSLAVLLVTEGNYFLELAIHSLGLKNPDMMRPDLTKSAPEKPQPNTMSSSSTATSPNRFPRRAISFISSMPTAGAAARA